MPVLGYCRVCEKLVPLKQGEYRYAGGKERVWYPREHEDEQGRPCGGEKKGL